MRISTIYAIMLVFCWTVFVALPEVGSAPSKMSTTSMGHDRFLKLRKRLSRSVSSNWKECSWNSINENKDYGLIKDCVFLKKYSNSALHVYWNSEFSVNQCSGCCKRWFFTFNGAECQSPRAIDGLVYLSYGTFWLHRVRHIEGHCNNVHKGHVRVGFNVGDCSGYGNANAYTGWNTVSRLFVEEVTRPQP
ncbi:collagen triple helix repeat-containing protein 1-like [Actinia tenebrosa]|uniref:Collagen triple helix repeat-containing protein 1-like n=1 Tax=Actinia tenebrosa TaxID=6105 RepID=A0A6P8JE50_ACTTE|nr:collagen triple helix repeat-containing protein 1-like [Actinia tenebrosa]